jgi:hypothetical protein
MRSSEDRARARAGQALTSAPIGSWPRPWARLAPIVAAVSAPRHQRAGGGRGMARRLASRMGMLAARMSPVGSEGQPPSSEAGLAVRGDKFVGMPVGDDGGGRGDGCYG